MYRQFVGFCAALIVVAVFAPPTKADLLAYEGFDYPNGTLLRLVGDEGGFGWEGTWTASNDKIAIRTAAALSYTDAFGVPLPAEGLGLHVERTYRTGSRLLLNPISEPGVYWISFLIQPTYIFYEGQSSTLHFELRVGTTVRATFGKFSSNPNYGIKFGSATAYSGVDAEENDAGVFPLQLIVVRYEIGSSTDDGTVHLFMNPNFGPDNAPALEDADAVLTGLNSNNMPFDGVNITTTGWVGANPKTDIGRGYIDEIRIATTYADATVPNDPATMLLVW